MDLCPLQQKIPSQNFSYIYLQHQIILNFCVHSLLNPLDNFQSSFQKHPCWTKSTTYSNLKNTAYGTT